MIQVILIRVLKALIMIQVIMIRVLKTSHTLLFSRWPGMNAIQQLC
eukprot:gene6498-19592_t